MSERQRWVVTTSPERPIEEVARELADHGFMVGDILDAIGCITGAAERGTIDALLAIEGVDAIEPDVDVDLPPGEEGPTW